MRSGPLRAACLSLAIFLALFSVSPTAGARAGNRSIQESAQQRLERLRARARATFLLAGEAAGTGHGPKKGGPGPGQGRSFSPEAQVTAGVPGTQSETTIAVFDNNVVVGFNQFDPGAPAKRSGVAFSTDGGLTFTDIGGLPVTGSGQTLLGDPSVTACGDGKFYYSSILFPNLIDSALSVSVGTVNGANINWTLPKTAIVSTNDFLDKEWLTCDRLTDTLYMTYTRFVNGNTGPTTELRIEIIKSVDGGNTWSPPLVLETSATESVQICYVATGPNSEVYTMWERGLDDLAAASTKLEFRRSFNLAASFDPKVVVRSMTPSFFPSPVGFNRESTLEIGTLAVDLSSGARQGTVYAIWVEREPGGSVKRDVFVASSANQGASWSAPVRVNDDPPGNDQVMPWLSVNSQGKVEAVWYDYRNWRGMHTVDLYASRSSDGGATFSPNFRVTTSPSSWFAPLTLTPNFGDYIGSASEDNGFYPAWADARNNDIDVFATHIPTATCGNHTLEAFEQCDDGNAVDGDSCSPACASTPCGNGTLEGAEQCDDGNLRSGDGCSQTCRNEVCGDGILQKTNFESCDDGNTVSGDGCSSACLLELDKMVFIADERARLELQSLVTGTFFIFGDPEFHELADLAFDASGNLFGAIGSNPNLGIGFNGFLVSMAAGGLPDRGAPIGDSGWQALTAIDFHPATGTLYGIGLDGTGTSRLITLSPATGATLSVVGDLGLNNAGAMAFDASGALYVAGRPGTTGGSSLYLVSLSPFSVTQIGPIGPYVLSGVAFAPDGNLYGVTQRGTGADRAFVQVNKATGTGTILFNTGAINQQGIRFAPAIAVDRDLDGIQDAADCSPLSAANASPGLASALAFTNASGTTMTWTAASGSRHSNTYRGTITGPLSLRPPGSVFDHVCFESDDLLGDGPNTTTDFSTPPLGTAYYYVSAGEGCGDGLAGPDAAHPMPPMTLCPTPP